MKTVRPIYMFVAVAVLILCITAWQLLHIIASAEENKGSLRKRTRLATSITRVSSANYQPPRAVAIAFQVDGAQEGKIRFVIRDDRQKALFTKEYLYNGFIAGTFLKDEIKVKGWPAGEYFAVLYLDDEPIGAKKITLP